MTEVPTDRQRLPRITLPMVDEVRIVVPNVCSQLTPYVLIEQQDWFEDEIKFLRRALRKGQQVIDIGANYGVYTLSMARSVGSTGHVWAFEPASETAGFLAESIAVNGFQQVTLIRQAVSRTSGAACLAVGMHSESNALVESSETVRTTESVQLTSLDDSLDRLGWNDEIAFLKIDAEGEEAKIIEGGKRFFAARSPLVQYEINASGKLHLELVDAFAALGYASYRLVPGLDVLAPLNFEADQEEFILNLFCCKRDRAATLQSMGLLVGVEELSTSVQRRVDGLVASDASYDWRSTLSRFPYGRALAGHWERTVALGESRDVCRALALYALSRDRGRSPAERLTALRTSLESLQTICQVDPAYQRLSSLARAARAFGYRRFAVNQLQEVCQMIADKNQVDLREPFLVPEHRYERVDPQDAFADWMLSAAVEAAERSLALSSYFTGRSSLTRLEHIVKLGFCSQEMHRRCDMIREGYGQPSLL